MALTFDDTIAAISTPVGKGGIGIVRLSGPDSLAILERVFLPKRKHPSEYERRLCYGWALDADTGQRVDEVLAAYFPPPNTYTRQQMVEINAHGGAYVLRRILEICLKAGARLAEPGELTMRAFLNGRIDLSQAEAVQDIVNAKGERALHQAMGQLAGALGEKIHDTRLDLLRILASIEAAVDFEQNERDGDELADELTVIINELRHLEATAKAGIIRRDGLRVAIVGKPNVGKSSLLNLLLRTDRAIVTDIAGTTRDTLEETADIHGLTVVFVDTAGLGRQTPDIVEKIGMERSQAALAAADVALLVLDSSQPLDEADAKVAALAQSAPSLVVVWNKIDISTHEQPSPLSNAAQVRLSAKTGLGLPELEKTLLRIGMAEGNGTEAVMLTNARQRDAVSRAMTACQLASDALRAGIPQDMAAIDIRIAVSALGEITGETASDELLAVIFSNFCVGK